MCKFKLTESKYMYVKPFCIYLKLLISIARVLQLKADQTIYEICRRNNPLNHYCFFLWRKFPTAKIIESEFERFACVHVHA